jgi:cell wall-associated NlpC family hydrolase
MEKLSAAEIFAVAVKAGFTPDQAVTMTAVALAESSGNPQAQAIASNEQSHGLWQINRLAHSQYSIQQLSDPLTNARAAFEISQQGRDISPWTVTHQSNGTPYHRFEEEALAAARANGIHDPHGYFDGVKGYCDHHPADLLGGAQEATSHPDVLHPDDPHLPIGPTAVGDAFLHAAEAQVGDHYILGATPAATDANPHTFDCSSLVQWAAGQAGVHLERTAESQYLQLKGMGTTMSVDEALHTKGALLFHFPAEPIARQALGGNAHVAISLGDGRILEAANPNAGVREVDVKEFYGEQAKFFTNAAYEPSLVHHLDDHLAVAGTAGAVDAAGHPVLAPVAPAAPELGHLGGFWRGDPVDPNAVQATAFVLHRLSPDEVSPSVLPALPKLGLQSDVHLMNAEHSLAPTDGTASDNHVPIPGLQPLPPLHAVPVDSHAEVHPTPPSGLHPLPPLAGDNSLQHLIDTHHSPGDHDANPLLATGAPLAGEIDLHAVASGHELPGEINLHAVSAGHELPGEINLHAIASGHELPGEVHLPTPDDHPPPPDDVHPPAVDVHHPAPDEDHLLHQHGWDAHDDSHDL